MKRMARALFALSILGILLTPAPPTLAHVREPYTMEILVDGQPLTKHAARGRTYIEAIPEREYSLRLRNNTSRRVAIALSVDGLNTIDAKTTTAQEASKWILGPHQSITLDGWQTSRSTARRFFFTTEERSYGAWLGQTSDLGVITAAVFRERRPKRVPISQGFGSERKKLGQGASEAGPQSPAESRSDAAAGAPVGEPEARTMQESLLSDDLAATGIGRKMDHHVRRVHFDAESEPAVVMELRYEYHDALVRLGVLPKEYVPCEDPLSRRENAHGFEGMAFAPDPYDRRCP